MSYLLLARLEFKKGYLFHNRIISCESKCLTQQHARPEWPRSLSNPSSLATRLSLNDLAFLIENELLTGKRVIFNLGTRNDYWNIVPGVQRVFGLDSATTGVKIDKYVAHILVEEVVSLDIICILFFQCQEVIGSS